MRKSRYTEPQIVAILKEHDATGKTAEICRRHGIHPNTRGNRSRLSGLSTSVRAGKRETTSNGT